MIRLRPDPEWLGGGWGNRNLGKKKNKKHCVSVLEWRGRPSQVTSKCFCFLIFFLTSSVISSNLQCIHLKKLQSDLVCRSNYEQTDQHLDWGERGGATVRLRALRDSSNHLVGAESHWNLNCKRKKPAAAKKIGGSFVRVLWWLCCIHPWKFQLHHDINSLCVRTMLDISRQFEKQSGDSEKFKKNPLKKRFRS